MEITIEQIENYVNSKKEGKEVENLPIEVNTNLSISEQLAFVNNVVEMSYIDSITYSPLLSEVVFIATFIAMCTNVPVATNDDGSVDLQKTYEIAVALGFVDEEFNTLSERYRNSMTDRLDRYVREGIEFQNKKLIAFAGASSASDEAIEAVSTAAYKLTELFNTAIEQLEKNGNKLFKGLTKKNISDGWKNIQETIAKSAIENNRVE